MRKPLANNRIRAKKVRVIEETGKNLGIVSLKKALKIAKERGLDLIQVTKKVQPPVCKLGDLGKYLYKLEKKEGKEKGKTELKEVRLTYNIAPHDLKTKLRMAEKFLREGNQIRIKMELRGREKAFKDLAKEKMISFLKSLKKRIPFKMVKKFRRSRGRFSIIIIKA